MIFALLITSFLFKRNFVTTPLKLVENVNFGKKKLLLKIKIPLPKKLFVSLLFFSTHHQNKQIFRMMQISINI